MSGLRSEVVQVKLMADGPYSLAKAVEIAEFCDKIPVREQGQQTSTEIPRETSDSSNSATLTSKPSPTTSLG